MPGCTNGGAPHRLRQGLRIVQRRVWGFGTRRVSTDRSCSLTILSLEMVILDQSVEGLVTCQVGRTAIGRRSRPARMCTKGDSKIVGHGNHFTERGYFALAPFQRSHQSPTAAVMPSNCISYTHGNRNNSDIADDACELRQNLRIQSITAQEPADSIHIYSGLPAVDGFRSSHRLSESIEVSVSNVAVSWAAAPPSSISAALLAFGLGFCLCKVRCV